MEKTAHDLFVIGGGINGSGIARDAVGRGYSVALAEMNDFASGTSGGVFRKKHSSPSHGTGRDSFPSSGSYACITSSSLSRKFPA